MKGAVPAVRIDPFEEMSEEWPIIRGEEREEWPG
jgi:hypothetical protein